MANTADPEKEANPIAEIFDEMFTLMQDLETRSVAVLEYLQEQGGVTDEKLAPYLDRAAAAADVRWRAARASKESQDSKAQNAKSSGDAKTQQKKTGDEQEDKEKKATSKDAESQAA